MRVKDFGHFDGPVALFGGPYSNFQATEAFARDIGDMRAICTGDLVAYAGSPRETVELIREKGWPVVAGNCETQLAEGAEDCGCGFEEGTACDLLSKGWYPYALREMPEEARAWMGQLPDIGTLVQQGRRYAVVHASVETNNRFIWASTLEVDLRREIELIEEQVGPVQGVVAGHSGIAFHRVVGEHQWINAGAIGMPPHDGRPDTRYAVLENGEVFIHRLSYDSAAARAVMEKVGLTQGYHEALTSGVWPSEDVLPHELRR